MNRKTMARLILGVCLLSPVAPVGLGGCGGNAEQLRGTETGNPPDVDMRRLRLVWTQSGVELVGEAGAVPRGAEVTLRNSRTGESAMGIANADGSLRLSVPGSPTDPYELTVVYGGGQTTEPLTPASGSMFDDTDSGMPSDEVDAPSCLELEMALRQSVVSTFVEGPLECSVDSDCVQVDWRAGCYTGCGQSTIAASAVDATRALAEQRAAPICAELASCNSGGALGCPAPEDAVPACIEGACQPRPLSQLSCDELGNQASLRRLAAMESANRACSLDSDCSLVGFGVRCFADCGVTYPVASTAVQQVEDDVARVESTFCGHFDAAICPAPLIPPCVPPGLPPEAACVDALCTVVFSPDP